MIDVHCHLEYMPQEEVLSEATKHMEALITSVAKISDAEPILELHKKYINFVYVSLGLHPSHLGESTHSEINDYLDYIRHNQNNIVAVGETGLDYHHITDKKEIEESKNVFALFIRLARELKKPIVIHLRNGENKEMNAFQDCWDILEREKAKNVIIHCFSGNEQDLRLCLDRGYWISFATIICKSEKHQRLAKKTPLDRMLLETDSPWLDPYSRDLVNRPWKIEESAEIIAKLHKTTKDKILVQTAKNVKKVFGIL